MKKILLLFTGLLFCNSNSNAQQVDYTEYDLENGMHVILHQDNTAPVVTTSVMYHVGAKDENPERTGFAHFFEHLLFEGTVNIPKGEWFTIVSSNGGSNNANTTDDRTYYYEVFPSNNVELGIWMESERLLHPVINQEGVDTQNEVVKEEKRQSYDRPYGKIFKVLGENLFSVHPAQFMGKQKRCQLLKIQLLAFAKGNILFILNAYLNQATSKQIAPFVVKIFQMSIWLK